MANWNLPTITSDYLSVFDELNARFLDVARLDFGSSTNIPNQSLRYNRGNFVFEEYDGVNWNAKPLSVAGGGTGANNPASARTNLGIGSMGVQNSNNVNITGGSITGVSYSADDITSGIVALARGGTGSSLVLGAPGFVLLSDGAKTVYASGVNIDALNASSLTTGTVPAARLTGVALLAGVNVFTSDNRFTADPTATGPITVVGNTPAYQFNNTTNADVDARFFRFIVVGGNLFYQKVNAGYGIAISLLIVRSDGVVICEGSGIYNLNGANIASGIINPARLGTGVANSTTFLRGDNTWQPVSTSGSEGIPPGLIAIFPSACPPGWIRIAQLDGRFPMGASAWGTLGGAASHNHGIGLNSSLNGGHGHSVGASGNATGNVTGTASGSTAGGQGSVQTADAGGSFQTLTPPHHHDFSVGIDVPVNLPVNVTGNTNAIGDHSHQINGNTADAASYPPYITVVYCQKT